MAPPAWELIARRGRRGAGTCHCLRGRLVGPELVGPSITEGRAVGIKIVSAGRIIDLSYGPRI